MSTQARKAGNAGTAGNGPFFRIWLEKLENHRLFSCFGWKSWDSFSGLRIMVYLMKNDLIEKHNLRRKDCSISHGTGHFSPNRPRIESFPSVLSGWLVNPCPPGGAFRKILNLRKKFQFIANFKVIHYFVTIFNGWNFMSKFTYGWKTMCFFFSKGWKEATYF